MGVKDPVLQVCRGATRTASIAGAQQSERGGLQGGCEELRVVAVARHGRAAALHIDSSLNCDQEEAHEPGVARQVRQRLEGSEWRQTSPTHTSALEDAQSRGQQPTRRRRAGLEALLCRSQK